MWVFKLDIHIEEPEGIHYVINNGTVPVKMISTLAPFKEVDKVKIDNYAY